MSAPIAFPDKKHVDLQDSLVSSECYELVALLARGWTKTLELYSGSSPLVCSIRCVKLEVVTLRYEALSYVWGHDALQNTVNIECNGRVSSV